jgi:polygalacturonase
MDENSSAAPAFFLSFTILSFENIAMSRSAAPIGVFLTLCCCYAAQGTHHHGQPQVVLDVETYGAVADNSTLGTSAFRAAFRAAAALVQRNGAAVVVRAAGPGVYITGCFNITSMLTFEVSLGATVMGVQDDSDEQYTIIPPLPSYGTSRDTGCHLRHQALIMSPSGTHDIKITGGGIIDGAGSYWWHKHQTSTSPDCTANRIGRPRLVELYNTSRIEVAHIRLQNSGFWTLHPVYSSDIWIHDVTVWAPASSPNTDGIDPDSSQNVLIERCTISCGDDHIAIKSGLDQWGRAVGIASKNITIVGNIHYAGRGISIGSEVSGGVQDVLIKDVSHIGPSEHGLHIKTAASRGGYVRNVVYQNITMGQIVGDALISVTTSYGLASLAPSPSPPSPPPTALTDMRNIAYTAIRRGGPILAAKSAGTFSCFSTHQCVNISLTDVHLEPAQGWRCQATNASHSHNVTPSGSASCFSVNGTQ